jgi:hypothetical protein
MNRYDNGSISKFSPLSFQELSAVPLMQRQKHDQLIAQQEMLRQGLAKVDPLDVHMNEAINLKSQIENKLVSQAELLSREGVNPNTQGDFLALNREYQNMVSPTGKLGQINAAKQVYAKNFNDFVEDAQKNKGWSRERALANWDRFSKQYTGFDNDNIASIGQLGAPKKVEVMDVLKDVKSLLGEQVVGEMKASGYNFQAGPDGSMVMVDRSGRRIETSNKPNLQAAQNLINQKLMGKEWQDSIKFEGENTLNVYNQLTSGINSMLSNKVVDNRSENAQYIAPKVTKNKNGDEETNLDAVNVESINISKNSNLLNKLSGKSTGFTVNVSPTTGIPAGNPTMTSQKVINETLNSTEYKNLARAISRTQKLGNDLKSQKVQNAVTKYLNENKDVTIQNRYVDANAKPSDLLFASKENSKDKKESSRLLMERVRAGAYEMIDSQGNKIDKTSTGNYRLEYNGDMTAKSTVLNSENNKPLFNNPKQNIGLRRASLIDKDGNSKTVYISRSSSDFDTPQFKAMETINAVSKIVDVQPGIYHAVKSPLFDAYGMKNVEIKYNKNKNAYNMSYTNSSGQSIDVKDIPDSEFQTSILNDYNELYKK